MIERIINDVQLLVNPNAANEIYFDEVFLKENCVAGNNLSPSELCGLISGNSYTPMILTWELLDKCNFSCPFCYIVGHSNHKLVRFKDTQPYIKELIDKGMLYCTLTGGETLLHKDFPAIYKFLKQSGVLVEIYSNGHLIDGSIIELFKEFPPYRIEISIYAVSQEKFNDTTGTKFKDFKLVLDNVLNLKSNGINVKCKTPFNSATQNDFEQIGRWCRDNGVDYYYSTNIYDAYDGQKLDGYKSNFERMIEMEAKKIEEIEAEYPGTFNLSAPPKKKSCYTCGVRNYGLHINANFDLLPCSETHTKESTYNIFQYGIDKSLQLNRGFVNKHMDKPIIGCIGCEASNTCKMCTAIAKPKLDTNNEILYFELPDGHCENERKKYNALVSKLCE